MAIQLESDPIVKINGELLEGYIVIRFKMTKRLLEPNRFDFTFQKENLSLTQDDIKFELRESLLGALVECSVSANRYDLDGDWHVDEVPNFFRGYIQNVKVERTSMKSRVLVHCTAFSPDARLKQYPSCSSRTESTLKDYVDYILLNPSEASNKFKPDSGEYETMGFLDYENNPRTEGPMPYTVQYHESDYDFLKRLAKRYGEYFYFEDGKVVFGNMKEYDPVTLRTGIDLEKYDYDLNMNHHTGIALSECDYIICSKFMAGTEKGEAHNWNFKVEPPHEMSKSVFEHSTEFFNSISNAVTDCRSARIMNEEASREVSGSWDDGEQRNLDANGMDFWSRDQRRILEQYVMADTLMCTGETRRADLKLGSVIIIEDETNPEEGNSDYVQHEPLKIIDLTYEWKPEYSRKMTNKFKAIPQKTTVPPYLERDEQGFLTYGDFDIFPHCGPQPGRIYDNADPLCMGRVRVVLNWQFEVEHCLGINSMDEISDHITPWIRVAQPYGGLHRGSYVVPELYDEVMVGFEHNNAECPYVIASVHNWNVDETDPVWTEPDSVLNNEYKAIRTRNGHTIEIRDKDEHGYIKIYDNETNNYVVTYDTDKKLIRLQSAGNIELKAGANIVLNAGNNIIVNAGNDMETIVKKDKKMTVANDQLDIVLGNRIANVSKSDQVFVDGYYALAVNTDKEGNFGTRLVLNDEELYAIYSQKPSGNESMLILMDKGGQIITDFPNGVASLKSCNGETEVVSEARNVSISAAMNVEMEAQVEASINGKVVKIN